MYQTERQHYKRIPPFGWALANIISLATTKNDSVDSGGFNPDLDLASYVQVLICLSETLLARHDRNGLTKMENLDLQDETTGIGAEDESVSEPLQMTCMDLFRPICQHWHLRKLVAAAKTVADFQVAATQPANNSENIGKLELLNISYLYSHMLRIFSIFNPKVGSLPVLNLLSFTPGFLVNIWEEVETLLFPVKEHFMNNKYMSTSSSSLNKKNEKQGNKDGGKRWVNALQKLAGKSQAEASYTQSVNVQSGPSQPEEESCDTWNVIALRRGPEGISKDISCFLHLFCATYSHLLLVLDDIEFYEKQVNMWMWS